MRAVLPIVRIRFSIAQNPCLFDSFPQCVKLLALVANRLNGHGLFMPDQVIDSSLYQAHSALAGRFVMFR